MPFLLLFPPAAGSPASACASGCCGSRTRASGPGGGTRWSSCWPWRCARSPRPGTTRPPRSRNVRIRIRIRTNRRWPAAVPVFQSRGATATRSPPPRQPRRDGADRSGGLPQPRIRTDRARRSARAQSEEPAGRNTRHSESGKQSRRPCNGTKRAPIGKSERLCEPLVPPGRCPLYVRNHYYASTHGDT